jgi:ABC-type antimicrobial peptide transport system permease subunit
MSGFGVLALSLAMALGATRSERDEAGAARSGLGGLRGEPVDPRVLGAAALVPATTLCAAWLLARRAARMDTMAALRNE